MSYATTAKELSQRERHVLALYMQLFQAGNRNIYQTIADLLSTTDKPVKKGYVNKALDNIQFKRDMLSRKELREWAMENGYDKVSEASAS